MNLSLATIKTYSRLICYKQNDENFFYCFACRRKFVSDENEVSDYIVFYCNGMGILNIDLKNINLDNNFDEDYLDTIILIRVLAWHSKSEKRKALKKLKWRIIINSVAS